MSFYLDDGSSPSVIWEVASNSDGILYPVVAGGSPPPVASRHFLRDIGGLGEVYEVIISTNGNLSLLLTTVPAEVAAAVDYLVVATDWRLYAWELADGSGVLITRKAPFEDELGLSGWLIVMEIDLTSGTRYYGLNAVAGNTKFYKPRVLSFSDFIRNISVLPGEYRVASFNVDLDNTDNHFSALKSTEAFLNREVRLLMGDPTQGEGSFTTIAAGRVRSWGGDARRFSLEIADQVMRRFEQTVTPSRVITHDLFPNAPEGAEQNLVPLVVGLVEQISGSATGALPSYLIDTVALKWVVAQGTVDVLQAYRNGVLMTLTVDYTVAQETYADETYTVLTRIPATTGLTALSVDADTGAFTRIGGSPVGSFLMDGFEPGMTFQASGFIDVGNNVSKVIATVTDTVITVTSASGLVTETGDGNEQLLEDPSTDEITVDVNGLKTSGGSQIFNPARIFERVLLENGFTTSELDAGSFTEVESVFAGRGIEGAFAETDSDRTLAELAERFAVSFNMSVITSKTGKIGVVIPMVGAVQPAIEHIKEIEIVQDSFQMLGVDDVASGSDYEYLFNYATEKFEDRTTFDDSREVSALGETIKLPMQLWYIREAASASAIARDKLFFTREARAQVAVACDPHYLRLLDIGSHVRLTHFGGLGASGFSQQLFRVLGFGGRWQERALLTSLTLVDVTEVLFPDSPKVWEAMRGDLPALHSDWYAGEIEDYAIEIGMR